MKRFFLSLCLVALAIVAGAQGLVVGVFDGGFDYTHPAFRDADGRLCISRVWEQGTEGIPPDGYDFGLELSTPEAILQAGADNETQSHGTHVAARALQFAGKQEGTELVLVSKPSTKLDEARLREGIRYIFDYAESVGKPCVINLSIGNHLGPHDGTSAFDRFLDEIVGPGRIIVGSAGNSGNSTCHLSTDGGPVRSFVIYRSPDYTQGTIDIWGSQGMQFSVQLSATQIQTGNVSSQSELVTVGGDAPAQTYIWAPSTGRLKGTFTFASEVSPLNGCPHVTLSVEQTSAAMNYDLALCITPLTPGTVHAWADDIYSSFHNRDREDFATGDNLFTISELGGTADSIISVGAVDASGKPASFSSVGPRLDGAVKPNVYAYGADIESALNSYDQYQSSYPQTQSVELDGRTYHYGRMSGTSMAAPMVTGIVGSWLRLNPSMTPGEAMALMRPGEVIDAAWGATDGLRPADMTSRPDACYDLSGRQVHPQRPGIYLYHGRKISIK